MRFTARPYQARFIQRLREHARVAGFIDMGLGKTVCLLTIIHMLKLRALIVAPKRVIESTWPDEIAEWDHTRNLSYTIIERRSLSANVLQQSDIHGISYDNIISLCESMPQGAWPWDLIIFDECSNMKNPTSKRMRAVRKVLHHFPRRVILSGTPALEGYGDLWSQIYLLDDGARLGAFISHFRSNYMMPADWQGWTYKLKPGSAETIERRIADLVVCLKSEDHISLPPIVIRDVVVELPPAARAAYTALEKDLFAQLDAKQVEAVNAAALSGKCCQLASGAVYDKDRAIAHGHDAKLAAVRAIVEDAQGSPVVIAYQFQHEEARLLKAFPQGETLKKRDAVERWNRGAIPVLVVHPKSAGHGLNLQRGPGHILIWYNLPWSGDHYAQMPKRLHRSGQAHPVIMHRIIARKTIDEAKVLRVEGKLAAQGGLLDALIAYRKSRGP